MKKHIPQIVFIGLTTLVTSASPLLSWPTLSQPLMQNQVHAKQTSKSEKQFKDLIEEYGFQIENYAYDYQGQKNVLNIDVLWRYVPNITKPQYPDVAAIKKDLEQFMQDYPDKMQYWEFLNKDVAQMILNKYPALASIRIKFLIAPNAQEAFARTSIVTLSRR
jgi:hypothetical protein